MRKIILAMALPILKAIGEQLKAVDDNDEGQDDLAGAAIIYASEVADAVDKKIAIPFPPDILLRGGKAPSADMTTAPLEQ